MTAGITRALKHAFRAEPDLGDNDDLIAALDGETALKVAVMHNEAVADNVVQLEKRLEKKLCLDCSPYRAKLRQLVSRRAASGAASSLRPA